MNSTRNYIQITLDRDHIGIYAHNPLPYDVLMALDVPNGRHIWWKLETPCLDIDKRFFRGKHCEICLT